VWNQEFHGVRIQFPHFRDGIRGAGVSVHLVHGTQDNGQFIETLAAYRVSVLFLDNRTEHPVHALQIPFAEQHGRDLI